MSVSAYPIFRRVGFCDGEDSAGSSDVSSSDSCDVDAAGVCDVSEEHPKAMQKTRAMIPISHRKDPSDIPGCWTGIISPVYFMASETNRIVFTGPHIIPIKISLSKGFNGWDCRPANTEREATLVGSLEGDPFLDLYSEQVFLTIGHMSMVSVGIESVSE